MAHFAEIDTSESIHDRGYRVLRVIVVADEDTADSDGNEVDAVGIAFCQMLYGADTDWIRCSFNGNVRGQYPSSSGFVYDPDADEFRATPVPFASWSWDADVRRWTPPTPYPGEADGPIYEWDEDTTSWVEVEDDVLTVE